MGAEQNSINPWVRADLERYNPETLELVRLGDRAEYISGMKTLAHWKYMFGVVMEQLGAAEEWRHDFFERQQDNVVQLHVVPNDNVIQMDAYRQPEPPEAA